MIRPLPPIGSIVQDSSSEAAVIADLQNRALEGGTARDEWTPLADLGMNIFLFGADPKPGTNDIYVNEIQTHIISSQLQTPPGVTLKPVETGEKAAVYWNGPQAIAIHLQLPAWNIAAWLRNATTGAVTTPEDPEAEKIPAVPIEDQQVVKTLLDLVEQGQLEDDWVVEINDRTIAETFQTVFDVLERRSNADEFKAQNMLASDIEGWKFGLYQFDDENKRHVLRNLPSKQVWMDPTVEDIQSACYAGFDLPIDADEAKKLWPDLAAEIDAYAKTGNIQPNDSSVTLGQAFDRDFQRPMVMFRIGWIRNQEMPLSVEAALALGKIEQREVADAPTGSVEPFDLSGGGLPGDESAQVPAAEISQDDEKATESRDSSTETAGEAGTDDGGGETEDDAGAQGAETATGASGVAESGEDETESADGGGGEPVGDEDGEGTKISGNSHERGDIPSVAEQHQEAVAAGQTMGQIESDTRTLAPPPSRTAYYLPGTATEVAHPDSADALPASAGQWPTRLVVRQITQICDHIVDDRPSEFGSDGIPIVQNVNIPIPGRPYGIGEPFRLMALQRAETRVLGSIVKHVEFWKAPIACIPKSMQNSLPDNQKRGGVKPETRFVPDDDIYMRFAGKPFTFQDPPAMPPALIQALQIITSKMTEQSGHTPARRGIAEPEVKSGRHEGLLQQAASSVIDYKHVRAGKMVKRLGELMHHSNRWRLSFKDIKRIVSRFPDPILEAIIERARRSDWDVEVEETAGGQQAQQMKNAEALEKWKNGAISYQTYCERTGEDYHQEMRRKRTEARKEAALQMQVAAMGASIGMGQPQQGQEKKPGQQGGNGNGQSKPAQPAGGRI